MESIRLKKEDFKSFESLLHVLEDIQYNSTQKYSFEYIPGEGQTIQFDFMSHYGSSSHPENYSISTFRILNHGILMASKGNLNLGAMKWLVRHLLQLLRQTSTNAPLLILDFQEVGWISREARDVFDQFLFQSDILIEQSDIFLVSNNELKIFFDFKLSFHHYPKNIRIVPSIIFALKHLHMHHDPMRPHTSSPIPALSEHKKLRPIETYTKEDLYKELAELKAITFHSQEERRLEHEALLNYMTQNRLYPEKWADLQAPIYDMGPQYAELFKAAYLLKRDVQEVVENFSLLEKEVHHRNHALEVNEANLLAILENTEDQIFSVDENGKILIANSAARKFGSEVLGISIEAGVDLIKSLPLSLKERWTIIFKEALGGKALKDAFAMNIGEHEFHFQCSINPILDPSGNKKGFSFYGRDISEEVKRKREVVRQQHLLLSVSKNIREGIFRTTRKDGVVYINQAFLDLFGYDSVDDIRQINLDQLYVKPGERAEIVDYMQKNTFFINKEVEFRRKDGTTFWGLMSSTKVEDEHGGIYFDGAVRDVTQIKEFKDTLTRKNQELTKLNKELDSFVYSTSHDLRAPLVSVLGLIDIMRLTGDAAEKEMYLNLMEVSIKKLESFIEDIIHYSQNSRSEVQIEEVDLKKIGHEAHEHFQFLPNSDQVSFRVISRGDFPFYSDKLRLQIIINNLVGNAISYADLEKESPFVRMEVHLGKEETTICIKDNGIGIRADCQDKVFDMFYRATKKSKGSGIGLYIVKEAVQKLQGQIELESTEGEGTVVRLHLPNRFKA